MTIPERIIVIILTCWDLFMNLITRGTWSRVRGSMNSNAIVKGK